MTTQPMTTEPTVTDQTRTETVVTGPYTARGTGRGPNTPRGLTVTVDLEDHRPGRRHPIRYERTMREVLAPALEEMGVTATIFVVGTVAERSPGLVADLAAAGHEIGLHGWDHEHLSSVTPTELAQRLARGRDVVGGIVGTAPVGYRAPTYSMTEAVARWAPDVLADEGFEYSSSVVPAPNPLHGFPGAPTDVFAWPCGLVEVPAPLLGVGVGGGVPFGGTYLRVLPLRVLRRGAHVIRRTHTLPWCYLHPYDIDRNEPFWWEPVAGPLAPLLWVGRRQTLARVRALTPDGVGRPLVEGVRSLPGPLPVFTP